MIEFIVGELEIGLDYPENLVVVPQNWIIYDREQKVFYAKYDDPPFDKQSCELIKGIALSSGCAAPESWKLYIFKPYQKFSSFYMGETYLNQLIFQFTTEVQKNSNKKRKLSPKMDSNILKHLKSVCDHILPSNEVSYEQNHSDCVSDVPAEGLDGTQCYIIQTDTDFSCNDHQNSSTFINQENRTGPLHSIDESSEVQ